MAVLTTTAPFSGLCLNFLTVLLKATQKAAWKGPLTAQCLDALMDPPKALLMVPIMGLPKVLALCLGPIMVLTTARACLRASCLNQKLFVGSAKSVRLGRTNSLKDGLYVIMHFPLIPLVHHSFQQCTAWNILAQSLVDGCIDDTNKGRLNDSLIGIKTAASKDSARVSLKVP